MRRFGLGIAVAALSGCTTITPPPNPESARIVVAGAVSQDAIVAAFAAEGLAIAGAAGAVIVSVPLEIGHSVYATYRATRTDSAVILSGTIRNQGGAIMASSLAGTAIEAPEDPLHSAMTGEPLAGAWQRMVRIGNRLRGTP